MSDWLRKPWIWVLLGTILYSMVVWWPTKDLPYHWDSAGFVINASRDLRAQGFWPWVAEHSDFAHPPLLMTVLGMAWNLWGESLRVSHVLMFPFLPIFMMSSYWIVQGLMEAGKERQMLAKPILGTTAALLSGMLPFALAEYGMIYIDLPASALAAAALAAGMYRRYVLAGVLLALGTMFKESVLLTLPAIVLLAIGDVWQIENMSEMTWSRRVKKLLKLEYVWIWWWMLLPVLIFGAWLVYHQAVTGWGLVRPERPQPIAQNLGAWWQSFRFIIHKFAWTQGRWMFSLVGSLSLIALFSDKKLRRGLNYRHLFILAWIIFGLSVYAYTGEFALRYGLFLMPAYIALLLVAMAEVVFSWTSRYALGIFVTFGLICAWMSYASWWPEVHPLVDAQGRIVVRYEFGVQEDLSYKDMILIGKDAADYLELAYPTAHIFGGFPEVYQLTQPYQGYTEKLMTFNKCSEFNFDKETIQILYLHPYAPDQQHCRLLLNYVTVEPLMHFESGSKWLELYKVTGLQKVSLEGE